jgi:ferredoxin
VVCVGRRAGKSVLGLNRCADPTVMAYPVAWFSPTYKMLLEMWREAVRTFAPITARRSVQERRIEYTTGGMLEFWSLDNPDVARGRKYRRVVIDEAAMVPNLMDAWQYAIRPTLADYNGDAWFLSTPKGRNGFWQLWQRGQDGEHADWQSWQMASGVNPRLAKSEIDDMRDTLPESVFRQEVEAAFIDNGAGVFRNIAACLTAPTDATPEAHAGHHIIAGADWARESDYTCFSVGCATCRVELARDRFNQVDYHVQTQRLQALAERWQPVSILTELNSIGTPVFEMLARLGLPVVGFTTTAQSKPPLIENMALAFERGEWAWQADPVWTAELEAYERTVSATTGRSSYSAPAGGHDDCVISRALMLWQATNYVPLLF